DRLLDHLARSIEGLRLLAELGAHLRIDQRSTDQRLLLFCQAGERRRHTRNSLPDARIYFADAERRELEWRQPLLAHVAGNLEVTRDLPRIGGARQRHGLGLRFLVLRLKGG